MNTIIPTFLRKLGLRATMRGFRYLCCGLQLVIQDESYLLDLTKRLYPDIADAFDVTSSRVERCLRTLVDSFWYHGNKELLEELAGRPLRCKPYVGEFIDILYGYLSASYEYAK